ncbi:MAG: endonuclease domain-containing protein [Chloroflexi bacterium]|nr:endonuclease domain-containing protein [Chloroflexota bacterium]
MDSAEKPITHTERAIYGDIEDRARSMRKSPTPAEEKLWRRIRKKQVSGYRFRRQYAISRYITDFYCPEAKLAIELDGDIHGAKGQAEYDEDRQLYLEELGLSVLRFTNDQVINNTDAVVDIIRKWLTRHAVPRPAWRGRK